MIICTLLLVTGVPIMGFNRPLHEYNAGAFLHGKTVLLTYKEVRASYGT